MQSQSHAAGRDYHLPAVKRSNRLSEAEMPVSGSVKWYDPIRQFGFIVPDGGGADAFVHRSHLMTYGIDASELMPGTPVKYAVAQNHQGRFEIRGLAIIRS